MKKIIALSLSLLIIMSQASSVFAWTLSDEAGNVIGQEQANQTTTPDDDEDVEPWEILDFLYAIGAVDENVIEYKNLDKEIDKVTFVSAIAGVYFFGDSGTGPADKIFSDVPADNAYAMDVSRLAALGIISGKGDGTLGADDKLSLDEAYSITVRALGYGQYAEALGGYPTGSGATARELDITIDVNDRGAITVREAVQLLYNALNCEMFTFTGIDGTTYKYEPGETFLKRKAGIAKKRGIVYSSGLSAIAGKVAGVGNAIIGEDILSDEEQIAAKYLGYNAEYFFNEDDELLWVFPYKTTSVTIHTDEDPYYENGYVYHGIEKVKKEKISVDELSILCNGGAAASIEDIIPAYGEITLIDNDRDNVYEAAIVYDYKLYYLSSLNKDKKELRLADANENRVVNLEDYESVSLRDSDGDELTSLKAKSVVMVAENGKSIVVILCENSFDGTVTGLRTKNLETYLTIDGEDSKLYANAYKDGWNGETIPKKLTFFTDMYGTIAAVFEQTAVTTGREWKIGWYLRTVEDDESENGFIAKIAESSYADVETYKFAEKIKIDGEQYNLKKGIDMVAQLNGGKALGVVRYLIVNDELKALDLPDQTLLSFMNEEKISEDEYNKLFLRISGQRYYIDSQNTLVTTESTTGDGIVYFASGSVLFDVPERASALSASSDDIAVAKSGDLVDHVYYELDAYTIGSKANATNVLVVYGANLAAGTTSTAAEAMVITDVSRGLDDDDNPVDIITGYSMGSKKEYMVSSDGLKSDSTKYGTVTSLESIKPGDVVKFTTDRYRKIEWIQKIWGGDGVGYINKYGYTDSNIMGVWRYINANIINYSDNILSYTLADGTKGMNRIDSSTKVYMYDRQSRGNGAYKAASSSDVQLAADYPSLYEAVLIGSYHTNTKEVILIKK